MEAKEVEAKEVEAKQVKDERGGGWSRRNSTSAARSGWLAFTAKRQWPAFVPDLCTVIQTYSSIHHAQWPRASAPSVVSSANISNVQIRGALWRILRYKCFLAGVRLEWQQPWKTSHVCPRCGQPASTYRSPDHRDTIEEWGAWLCCSNPVCGWNGSRDYAASVNIARLGAALIRQAQTTGRVVHPSITDSSVQPVSYMGTWAALRLPPPAPRGRLVASGRIYCNGGRLSVKLRSSYATPIMLRLCG